GLPAGHGQVDRRGRAAGNAGRAALDHRDRAAARAGRACAAFPSSTRTARAAPGSSRACSSPANSCSFTRAWPADRSGKATWLGALCGVVAAALWAATTVVIRATRLSRATATKTRSRALLSGRDRGIRERPRLVLAPHPLPRGAACGAVVPHAYVRHALRGVLP